MFFLDQDAGIKLLGISSFPGSAPITSNIIISSLEKGGIILACMALLYLFAPLERKGLERKQETGKYEITGPSRP